MLKKVALVVFSAFILAGCGSSTANKPAPQLKQLVNELAMDKRPFVGIFPHSSGKLLNLYIDNLDKNFKSASVDMEYLSGNALKGGSMPIKLPASMPLAQGFLLGSCSTGGKCSFDTNLINGTIKTKLQADETTIHVLKSDFLFVNGAVTSIDGRVTYTPAKAKQQNQIIDDTQGLPKPFTGDLAYSPLMISAISADKIAGTLIVKASAVKSVKIYDGNTYQDIPASLSADQVKIPLNQVPWSKDITITRDDQKGATEAVTIYAVGPILLIK